MSTYSTFTSRLPKSTSARRPSNPGDGSTSLIGSNIPISVRKANLFTPQPKRSLIGGLGSTSRKSFMTTDKKYQRTSRPAPDRDEQIRMFENLVVFLETHASNFPIPEQRKFFSSVSTTECSRIFEFLISRIYPDFKINKLEIDVPEALANLDYPYIRSVTKSALVSITTRQAIVNLLLIFDWLVNSVRQLEGNDQSVVQHNFESQGSGDQQAFYDFMTNSGDPLEEQLREKSEAKTSWEKLDKIRAEREEIAEENRKIEELEEVERNINEDMEKYEKYEEDMENYFKAREGEEKELMKHAMSLDDVIAKLSMEHEILLPSVDSDMDDDVIYDLKALETEIKLKDQEMDTENHVTQSKFSEFQKEDRELREIVGRKNTGCVSLKKEWADKKEKADSDLKACVARSRESRELDNNLLRAKGETMRNGASSLVRTTKTNAKCAMDSLRLVQEDNKSLRKTTRRIRREV